MKYKICLIVSSKVTLNSFLLEPIKLLSEFYEVFVILKADSSKLHPDIANKVTVLNVDIERKIHLWKDLRALFQIIKILRQHQFSLVHSITPKAGLLGMLAAFLCKIKIRIHTFTGQVWVTKQGIPRWCLKSADRIIGFLSTKALVDSHSQRQFLLNESVLSVHQSSVLCEGSISGVDTLRFKPNDAARVKLRRDLNFSDQDIVFLYLGRLSKDKGLLDLAQAFLSLDNENARLLIVGPDEEHLKSEIKEITKKVSNFTRYIDFATNPEEYMAVADVLCLPSYREGFGNVIIEAAAVGIPAIGTRIYGLTDAIDEEYSGFLFEPHNIAELKSCMRRMSEDSELRIRLGNQARDRVMDKFSSKTLSKAWLQYYQDSI